MLIICLLFSLIPSYYCYLISVDTNQCDKGWIYLKKQLTCKDCLEFCSNLIILTVEEREYCLPFCQIKTTAKITPPTTLSTVLKTSSTTLLPDNASIGIYIWIPILVILVIIFIGLLVYFLVCRKRRENVNIPDVYYPVRTVDVPTEDNTLTESGVVVVDNIDSTKRPLNPNAENQIYTDPKPQPIDNKPEPYDSGPPSMFAQTNPPERDPYSADIDTPYLPSMPLLRSMDPITESDNQKEECPPQSPNIASMDPKPIQRDSGVTQIRYPELVQPIMTDKRKSEAPSELIKESKKKPNVHFDSSKDISKTIVEPSFSSEEGHNSSEDPSRRQFDSIFPTGDLDSLPVNPEDSSGSLSPELGSGNSKTIIGPKYPSIESQKEVLPVDNSNEAEVPQDLSSIGSQIVEMEDPFADLHAAAPETPPTIRTASFFSVIKKYDPRNPTPADIPILDTPSPRISTPDIPISDTPIPDISTPIILTLEIDGLTTVSPDRSNDSKAGDSQLEPSTVGSSVDNAVMETDESATASNTETTPAMETAIAEGDTTQTDDLEENIKPAYRESKT